MRDTVFERFSTSVNAVWEMAYIEHGIKGEMSETGYSMVFTGDDPDRTVALTWSGTMDEAAVRWTIERSEQGTVEDRVEGVFPDKDPGPKMLGHISRVAPTPPVKTVAPKGRLAAIVFGWTMILGVLALIRLLAVAIPPTAWETDSVRPPLPELIETAQQIANTLTLGDLPILIIGTFLNAPIPGLALIFGIGLLFILFSLPQIGLRDDVLSWRAIGIYGVTVLAGFGLVSVTPFPWNILVGLAVVALAVAMCAYNAVPWQLNRWLRFARTVQISRFSNVATTLVTPADGGRATLKTAATALEERALRVQRKLWKKRDRAFKDPSINDAYFNARLLKVALAREYRAAKRSRVVSRRAIERAQWGDAIFFRVLQTTLYQAIPLATGAALILLVGSPTPWLAPVCATTSGESETVYILRGGTPAYLNDATREVTVLTSWDDYSLEAGSCSG